MNDSDTALEIKIQLLTQQLCHHFIKKKKKKSLKKHK